MKVAVIGCGKIAAGKHIPAYFGNPATDIKYLVDIQEDRAVTLAKKYDVPYALKDYRDFLADPEVEAVTICTPNDSHASISIDCLDAGKNVLCEKPAAMNLDMAEQMKRAADRNGKILNIGFANRFNTSVNKIKNLIDSGSLGQLYHIYCSFRSHRSIPGLGGAFTTLSQSGGGVLIDWGVHFLDLVFYCIGSPVIRTVTGTTNSVLGKDIKGYTYIDMWAGPPDPNGTYDVEDFVSGLIRTEGPAISFNGAWAQNVGDAGMYIEFLGDKAGVKFHYGADYTLYTTANGTLYESIPNYRKDDMFDEEVDSFIKSSMSKTKDRVNIDHAMITSQVTEAIYQSARLGREIVL